MFHTPCIVTQQGIYEWHKLGLGSSLVFCCGITIDGSSNDLTCGFESEIDCCIVFIMAIFVKEGHFCLLAFFKYSVI